MALAPGGWRFVRLYGEDPVLCVYACGPSGDVGVVIGVRPGPGEVWEYVEARHGRRGALWSCGDVRGAAEQVEGLLKHRMFPSTW
jgi:hypothetical protein